MFLIYLTLFFSPFFVKTLFSYLFIFIKNSSGKRGVKNKTWFNILCEECETFY